MPAPIRAKLSEEEDRTLKELCCADFKVPHRTKQRALVIRLNAHGWNTPEIAQFLCWHQHTVRSTLKRWATLGLGGLWEERGRGRKRSWSEADWLMLAQWLEEPRRYSATVLQRKWQESCSVSVGAEQVRRIVKKKVMPGNGYV